MGLRSVFVDDAAAMLGMSRRTVYYRIREGRLRTIRTPGGSQRVLVESIAALLRERAPRSSGITQISKSEALALEVQPLARDAQRPGGVFDAAVWSRRAVRIISRSIRASVGFSLSVSGTAISRRPVAGRTAAGATVALKMSGDIACG